MTEITCKCGCGKKKMVRTADVKRGWGLFYSKSCKAKKQFRDCGGRKLKFSTLINAFEKGKVSEEYVAFITLRDYPQCVDRLRRELGIDAIQYDEHPFSSEGLGQW
jgi:hypothetical protein